MFFETPTPLGEVVKEGGLRIGARSEQTSLEEAFTEAAFVLTSFIDADEWIDAPEIIADEMMLEFPGHRVSVNVHNNSLNARISGPRFNFDISIEIDHDSQSITVYGT